MGNDYFAVLTKSGIRPSVQRVAVYGYLCEHPEHPTVDTVYAALSPDYPRLSKTTVYNTLKLLADNGLIQTIQIEEDKLRYDANTEPHLHFKCLECGKIIDVFSKRSIDKCNSDFGKMLPA